MSGSDRIWAINAKVLPRGDITLVNLYFATHAYATDGADAVIPHQRFEAMVMQPLSYSRRLSILSGGRKALPSFGSIRLRGDLGSADVLFTDYAWDNRVVTVKTGRFDQNWSDMPVMMQGRAGQCTADQDGVNIAFADSMQRLKQPLQETLYGGTGGLDGGAALKGRPKPLCFGVVREVQPVLVDEANLVYQVHDGQISGVTNVRVNGVLWTPVGSSPGPAEWAQDAATGTFTLGGSTPPQALVTADVSGDDDPTFASDLPDVLKRLLGRYGIDDPDDYALLDLPAVTFGFYFTDPMTIEEAVDRIAAAAGFWWGWTATGLFQAALLGRLQAVSAPVLDESRILTLACTAAPPPAYEVKVGYQKIWRVHTDAEVADAAGSGERTRLTTPSAQEVARDFNIRTEAPSAVILDFEGWYDVDSDAEDVADELLAWFGQTLREWTVSLREEGEPLAIDVGDTVTLQTSRFGLDAGADFFVDGINRDVAAGRLTLTLVG